MSDHCELDFPAAAELARLQENALTGRQEPFVGTGDPDTVLSCAHGSWRLGDVTDPPAPACTELTKAGEPCKGTPGPDGLCAAHKPKGDDGAAQPVGPPVDADPQAQEGGQGQEAGSQEEAGGEEGPGQEEDNGQGPGA